MKIDEIRSIVQLMADHDLTEFKVEAEEMHLCIKRGKDAIVTAPMQMQSVMPAPILAAPAPEAPSLSANTEEKSSEIAGETIDSPIVGTFYTAQSPEQDAFVSVGSSVTPETIVCIIEAMKVMNEIKAEKSGTIKKILIDNAQAVEFGQPLFVIE